MKLTLSAFLFFLQLVSFSQPKSTFTLTPSDSLRLSQKAVMLNTDILGNIYYITSSNELIKLNQQGDFIGNFRARTLGSPNYIDDANAMLLFVFYPEAGILMQLDNMLNPINSVTLQDLGLSNQARVCRAYDNNFWVFDERAFKIKKLAKDLQVVVEGEWLMQKISSKLEVFGLEESGEWLYMATNLGLMVFDRYGMYVKNINTIITQQFHAKDAKIFYLQQGGLRSYDHLKLQSSEIALKAPGEIVSFSMSGNQCAILCNNTVFLYPLP